MKNKKPMIIVCVAVSLGVSIFLWHNWLRPTGKDSSSSAPLDPLNRHVSKQKVLQERAREHQQQQNKAIQDLTSEQVAEINDFVGVDRDTSRVALPTGGQQVHHNGKYRHAVLLQRNEDGEIQKVEVGPNGISHDE